MIKSNIQRRIKNNIPFVAYRFPSDKKFFLADLVDVRPFCFSFLDNPPAKNGFVVFPFDSEETEGWWYRQNEIVQFNLQTFKNFSVEKFETEQVTTTSNFDEYKEQFDIIQNELLSGKVKKVVLSRIINTSFEVNKHLANFFLQMCTDNPNAFVYLLVTSEAGIWAGASPELLINKESNNFTLVSLAGTKRSTEMNIENWTLKELEEQGIVSDFIDNQLKHFNIDNYTKDGPNIVRANSVSHLKTVYRFNTNVLEGNLGKLVRSLHPTPAISGEPKDIAMDIIRQTERHKRKFYGGFLGTVSDNDVKLYVNIRCINFEHEVENIYVGGGLTTSSNVNEEWRETEMKSHTVLRLF